MFLDQHLSDIHSSESDTSSVDEDFIKTLRKVKHTSKEASDPTVYTEGANTKDKIKPVTEYSYIHVLHNFWKWICVNYPSIISFVPPDVTPKLFKDLKTTYPSPPIILHKIKPHMFFEFIGTKEVAKYTSLTHQLRQGIKRLFETYDKGPLFLKLIMNIKKEEIASPRKRSFSRSRLIKEVPPKRSPKILDDDNSDVEQSQLQPLQKVDPTTYQILYAKAIAYHQWEVLESITPGLVLEQ